MHYVYILYSAGADKYYVGQTSDIEQRLLYHNELSEKSYTSRYRPWALKAVIEAGSRSQAVRMERYVKRQKEFSILCKSPFYPSGNRAWLP